MFEECSFAEIDMSGFSAKNVTNMSYMFNDCDSLTTIYTAADADWSSVNSSERIFLGCPNLVGGNGTKYDSNKVDATYARIDTSENPGYFTKKNFFGI